VVVPPKCPPGAMGTDPTGDTSPTPCVYLSRIEVFHNPPPHALLTRDPGVLFLREL